MRAGGTALASLGFPASRSSTSAANLWRHTATPITILKKTFTDLRPGKHAPFEAVGQVPLQVVIVEAQDGELPEG